MLRRIISLVLISALLFPPRQYARAEINAKLNIASYLPVVRSSALQDKFRPLHLRYFSYDNINDNFKVILDKGGMKQLEGEQAQEAIRALLSYFLIGITLPDDMFWVNLRPFESAQGKPDIENDIIDNDLAKTDVGRVMLEADLQLKKDTALFTSPQTPEGREYWNKLYKKAEEIYGNDRVSIPTLTRPWIVPGEIIVRESKDSVYVYKATLKVMLEEDYLRRGGPLCPPVNNSLSDNGTAQRPSPTDYSFNDLQLKALNTYSTQLIRELIIPKLTKEVNSGRKYAALRKVYYSLILSRWFKLRFAGKAGTYSSLINTKNLTNLCSRESWSKADYFRQYQRSFAYGEYNIKQPVRTPAGQVIRSYFSGGINIASSAINIRNGVMCPNDNAYKLGTVMGGRAVIDPQSIKLEPVIASSGVDNPGEDSILTASGDLRHNWEGWPEVSYTSDIQEAFRAKLSPDSDAVFAIRLFDDPQKLQELERNMFLLQLGKEYKDGNGQDYVDPLTGLKVPRAASMNNWIWTDLLRYQDSVALQWYREYAGQPAQYAFSLRDLDFDTAANLLEFVTRYRNALNRRYMDLACSALEGEQGLPAYAYTIAERVSKTFKEFAPIYELYKAYKKIGKLDLFRQISLNVPGEMEWFQEEAKKDGVIIMALGAAGPGAMCMALSKNRDNGETFRRSIERINKLLEQRREEPLKILTDEEITRVTGGTGLLRGYIPLNIGKEPMNFGGFNTLAQESRIELPADPVPAVFDNRIGKIRSLTEGENIAKDDPNFIEGVLYQPRYNFQENVPMEVHAKWIVEQIKKGLVAKGVIRQTQADELSDEEILNLSNQQAQELLEYCQQRDIPLVIEGYARAADGSGTSQDLKRFRLAFTKESVKLIFDLPATPTVASEFFVQLTIRKADPKYKGSVVYIAPTWGITKDNPFVIKGKVGLYQHPDSEKSAFGIKTITPTPEKKNQQLYAPAYTFTNLFGITDVEITVHMYKKDKEGRYVESKIPTVGGMESSNVVNVALWAAASMLSGANLSKAEIYSATVKEENDELAGFTGGQGQICALEGGVVLNVFLSSMRDLALGRQFSALRLEEGRLAQVPFRLEKRIDGIWDMEETIVPIAQQIPLGAGQLSRLNTVVSKLGIAGNLAGLDVIFLKFSGSKISYYSQNRPQVYLDISLLEEGKEELLENALNRLVKAKISASSAVDGAGSPIAIKATDALPIITDYLKSGSIVIFGDMHRGEEPQDDEIWDHELFLDYVEQLGKLSMNFSVALELPYQLEEKLNNPSVPVEDLLDEYWKLLADRSSVEIAEANSQIRGHYLFRLLSILKHYNIPIIFIDDINSHRSIGIFTDLDAVQDSNKDMAQKLLNSRKKYPKSPVLLMVGRNHVLPKIDPIWLGGDEMNSIPGVLQESGVSVKLIRPDDVQCDKEDSEKFDLIIKIDEKQQEEYLMRQRGVSPKGAGESDHQVSSALGGINFRILPMAIQPMGSFSGLIFRLPQLSQKELRRIDINSEIQEIKNMVQYEISPSGERIKRLIAACMQKKAASYQSDKLLLCLADIFKLEEENASESAPELKEALVIIDSQSSVHFSN